MKKENIIKYGTPILGVILVALLGTIFTRMGMEWFRSLKIPNEWLKEFIIPIVWTIIYSLFTIFILYLVKKGKLKKDLFVLLVINGILNVLWCLVYFAMNCLLGGLIFIILNLIASIYLLKEVKKVNIVWWYILCVYPIWLSIATCLNLATWILN